MEILQRKLTVGELKMLIGRVVCFKNAKAAMERLKFQENLGILELLVNSTLALSSNVFVHTVFSGKYYKQDVPC